MRVQSTNALITGAAQGVGAACAMRLAQDGVRRFILVDRQAEALAATADLVRASGADVLAIPLDLADTTAMLASIGAALDSRDPVDILINAAGTTARGGLADTTPDLFDFIFGLNVKAPFFLMQRVSADMPRGGTIVNICSMLAHGGPPFLMPYSASKAALATLTRSTANALKRRGVRAFGINLGWTVTPGEREVQTRRHGLPVDWAETIGARQPFGRLLLPDDPAALVAFLCSQDAAMMTGAIIDLDQFVAGTVDDNPGA